MRTVTRFAGVAFVLGFCLLFTGFAGAHSMWMNVSNHSPGFSPKHGARTHIYFGWGHRYPVDDFLTDEFLGKVFLFDPKGKKEELKPSPDGFRATKVKMKEKGGWMVGATIKPGFYTMYLDKGKMHHVTKPKTGLPAVVMSLYYEQYAKTLINVGGASEKSFSKPVGHKFEIVPLENPGKLKGCGGHFLPVRVLFDGKPARHCAVYATYNGFSSDMAFAYTTATDAQGKAKIRLLHHGEWLVKASLKLPASGDLTDKCNELHYSATLTFDVP